MTLKPESYAGAMSRLKGSAWETKCAMSLHGRSGDLARLRTAEEKCRVISDP